MSLRAPDIGTQSPFDPDATTWFAAGIAAGGTITRLQQQAVSDLVAGLKATVDLNGNSWWQLLGAIQVGFCDVATPIWCKINLKNPAQTFATHGGIFIVQGAAFQGNGVDAYFDWGFNPASITGVSPVNHSLAMYSQYAAISVGGEAGATGGGKVIQLKIQFSATNSQFNPCTTGGITIADAGDSVGFFGFTATGLQADGSNGTYVYNGVSTPYISAPAVSTTLSAPASTGASSVQVASITGISSGDRVGVVLTSNNIFWTTVNGAPSGTTVNLNGTLPSGASNGAAFYDYGQLPGGHLASLRAGTSSSQYSLAALSLIFFGQSPAQPGDDNMMLTLNQLAVNCMTTAGALAVVVNPVTPGGQSFTINAIDHTSPINATPGNWPPIWAQEATPPTVLTGPPVTSFSRFPANLFLDRFGNNLTASAWTFGRIADLRWGNRFFPPRAATGGRKSNDTQALSTSTPIWQSGGASFSCRCNYTTYGKALRATCAQDARAAGYFPRNDPNDPQGYGYLDFLDDKKNTLPGNTLSPTLDSSSWYDCSGFDAALVTTPTLARLNVNVATGGVVITQAWSYANPLSVFTTNAGPGQGNFKVSTNVVILPVAGAFQTVNGLGQILYGDNEENDVGSDAVAEHCFIARVTLRARIAHAKGLLYIYSGDPVVASGINSGLTVNSAPLRCLQADGVTPSIAATAADIIPAQAAYSGFGLANIADYIDPPFNATKIVAANIPSYLNAYAAIFAGPPSVGNSVGNQTIPYMKFIVSMGIDVGGNITTYDAAGAAANLWIKGTNRGSYNNGGSLIPYPTTPCAGGFIIPAGSPMGGSTIAQTTRTSGGTGYSINDKSMMANGAVALVNGVNGTTVTSVQIITAPTVQSANPVAQASNIIGTGTGLSLTFTYTPWNAAIAAFTGCPQLT